MRRQRCPRSWARLDDRVAQRRLEDLGKECQDVDAHRSRPVIRRLLPWPRLRPRPAPPLRRPWPLPRALAFASASSLALASASALAFASGLGLGFWPRLPPFPWLPWRRASALACFSARILSVELKSLPLLRAIALALARRAALASPCLVLIPWRARISETVSLGTAPCPSQCSTRSRLITICFSASFSSGVVVAELFAGRDRHAGARDSMALMRKNGRCRRPMRVILIFTAMVFLSS